MSGDQAKVTGRDRVVAAYKGGFADRVPAYPIAGSFAGCLDGLSIEEYCTNPARATRAMLNYYERYQPDIMIAFNDLAKEAEAVGCHVKYSDYVVPSIDRHVLQDDKGRLAKLEVPDPLKDGRLPAFPNVPTLKEAGFNVTPVPQVRGVVAPPGIPKENVAYWEEVFRKLTQTESWKKFLADNQFEDGYQNAAQLSKFYDEFTGQMRGILQEAGVKLVR